MKHNLLVHTETARAGRERPVSAAEETVALAKANGQKPANLGQSWLSSSYIKI